MSLEYNLIMHTNGCVVGACTGTLCQQDVDGLSSNGSVRIDDNFDRALTSTGREELLLLARRFRGRFANFFQQPYNQDNYEVWNQSYCISYMHYNRFFELQQSSSLD